MASRRLENTFPRAAAWRTKIAPHDSARALRRAAWFDGCSRGRGRQRDPVAGVRRAAPRSVAAVDASATRRAERARRDRAGLEARGSRLRLHPVDARRLRFTARSRVALRAARARTRQRRVSHDAIATFLESLASSQDLAGQY